jgi:4'-phosphopantetheinyl transferase superfamily
MSEGTFSSREKPRFEPCFPSLGAVRARRDFAGSPAWLHPSEAALADRLALGPIRLDEWCWGRAAAHALLPDGAWVGRDDEGAPIVHGADLKVTLTHTRKWVAAAVGGVVGIDVCDLGDAARVRRVLPRFGGDDVALLDGRGDADWCGFWAIKEAAAKAFGVGLFDGGLKASRIVSWSPLVVEGASAVLEDWGDAAAALVWR